MKVKFWATKKSCAMYSKNRKVQKCAVYKKKYKWNCSIQNQRAFISTEYLDFYS